MVSLLVSLLAMKLNSYLVKSRHGVFYLRIQKFGQDKRISLQTKDLSAAAIAAYSLGAIIAKMNIKKIKSWTLKTSNTGFEITTDGTQQDSENAIRALEVIDYSGQRVSDETLAALPQTIKLAMQQVAPVASAASSSLRPVLLRDAIDEYKPFLAKSKLAEKSKKMALSTITDLCSKLGADFHMGLIDDDLIELSWLEPRLKEVAATTAKRDLSFIRAFVVWSADKKRLYSPAPLTIKFEAKGVHWDYLNHADLKTIFDNLPAHANRAWHFWIPILGLYTGARISELASLKTEHFFEKSGLNVMHLDGTKTDASPRDLPLHPDLLRLGLLDFVASRRNHEFLFEITHSTQNGSGAACTKWYGTYRQKIGITDERKVFHSFRHTIIDLMNQASISHKAQCQYTGHSSAVDVHSKVYGRGALSLKVMQSEVVEKIDWLKYCGWQPDFESLKIKSASFLIDSKSKS